jgi:hypothetical protein
VGKTERGRASRERGISVRAPRVLDLSGSGLARGGHDDASLGIFNSSWHRPCMLVLEDNFYKNLEI